MKLTKTLVENILSRNYEDLPAEVIIKTKKHILDIMGVMFPASTLERACKSLEELAREGEGKMESTLIGFGGKVPCWMAAFINGSLCHPLDYDDTLDEFPNHPSANTFPAAFAIAEKVGNISGKEFIAAMALAIDLNVRLSAAPKGNLNEDYPWFPLSIFGVFSATAAAGKLLKLNADEMVNAFGIALDRASGITESMLSWDSEIRAIRDGYGNREGVFAALMAHKGITACKDSIEKLYKFFYKNNYDPSCLTSNLGSDFWGLKVSLKAWPACRIAHTYIKAALDIVKEYNFDSDKIEEVLLTVGKFGRDQLFYPLEEKKKPKLSINAKMSLPFLMGVVFAKKRVIIEDFFPENLRDSKVLKIAEKVNYKIDTHLSEGVIGAGELEVKMESKRSLLKREDIPYGHPKKPMGDEEIIAKFKDCARYAKRAFSNEEVDQLIEKVLNLENIMNLKEISQILE